MRMIYFMITSSFLIVLMLFVRSVFRKKLSPGIIYALWLIPLLRLMIPFGFVEVPVFGAMAELLNPSFAIASEIEMEAIESDHEKTDIFNEHVPMEENKQEHNGIKVYDSVLEMEPVGDGSLDTTEAVSVGQVNDHKTNIKQIGVTVWISGAVLLSVYVIVLNCRLQKKVNELEVIEQADGCDILLSREVKTPCLVGVRNPRILIPETVLKDRKLYEYAIRHELAHFHQKDHFWNVIRIFMCVVYWWNPFVWYGAKCAAEDAELACDERVLKNKTAQERKDYGYALLSMMENAQNSPLCMATSYFGGRNTTKQRIESIARKTATKKYILIPVVLLLVVFNIVGCVYPSDKSYIKTNDWTQGKTDEFTYDEAKYEYSLQEEFQSMLFYYETYEYGELTERSVLSYGELGQKSNCMILRDERHNYDPKRNFVLEMNGVQTSIPILQYDTTRAYAISHLYSENEVLEVSPGNDLILMAIYQEKNSDITHTYSCEVISAYDEQELAELFKSHNIVTLARLILSDLSAETLYNQMAEKEIPKGETFLSIDEYNETYSENVEVSLVGNTSIATKIIKQAEENSRAGYKEATLTYVDNAEVRWDYYTDNPWASNAERDALAQAALKELYTLTGYQVEECTYTTDGRSRFIFGKSAEYIKKNIAFYSRDYGFQLCGDNVPFIGFMNARKVHYSDVQQLDSPFDNDKIKGLEQVSQWFLERSGLYQGEMITGYEKINLDDTVYTHMRMNFDGGYYIVVMDEKIESIHNVMGPYME